MKPAVKFGLIGAILSVVISFVGQHYFSGSNSTSVLHKYLVQLVFLVSIVASIKSESDNRNTPVVELKSGMKAGILTSLIIVIFIGAYIFVSQSNTGRETLLKQSDESLAEYLRSNPDKDTSHAHIAVLISSFDSAKKAENWGYARFYLEKLNMLNAGENYSKEKEAINNKIADQLTSASYRIKEIIKGLIVIQLLLGMFISFVTTMLFRFKQQNA